MGSISRLCFLSRASSELSERQPNPIIGKYERSFSANPDIVTAHSLEVIRAHHAEGISHAQALPGHGSSTGNSHQGFVDMTDTWSEIELVPFRDIIQAGMCDMVMTDDMGMGRSPVLRL